MNKVKNYDDAPSFMTVREFAKLGIVSEHYLRHMIKENKIPGIYSGNRFLINAPKLIEKLNKESAIADEN